MALMILVTTLGIAYFFTERRFDVQGVLARLARRWNPPERRLWMPLSACVIAPLFAAPWPARTELSLPDWLVILIPLWCAASCVWAENRRLSGMKVVNFALCVTSAILVGLKLSASETAMLIGIVSGCYILLGIAEELASGSFRPLRAGYRFQGTVNAIKQAQYCSVLIFVLVYLHDAGLLPAVPTGVLLALTLTMLWLTRTRNSIWPVLFAGVCWLLWQPERPLYTLLLLVAALLAAVAGLAAAAADRREFPLHRVALLGRTDYPWHQFGGRRKVWECALGAIRERPLLGFGYGGFWQPERGKRLGRALQFATPVRSSDSLYLEVQLTTGLTGTTLIVALFASVFWTVFAHPSPSSSLLLLLSAYLLIHSVFEATLWQPNFRAFAYLSIVVACT